MAIRSNTKRHIARKNPFSETLAAGRLAKLKVASIDEGYAYGQKRAESYDPFVDYYAWKERRDATQPPHLVFANLQEEKAAAQHFLETYGALTEAYIGDTDREPDWWADAQAAQLKFTDPEAFYRKYLLLQPKTVSAGDPRARLWPEMPKGLHGKDLVRINLSEFWAEQEAFLLLYRLWEALENHRSDAEIRTLFRGAVGATHLEPAKERLVFRHHSWQIFSWRCRFSKKQTQSRPSRIGSRRWTAVRPGGPHGGSSSRS